MRSLPLSLSPSPTRSHLQQQPRRDIHPQRQPRMGQLDQQIFILLAIQQLSAEAGQFAADDFDFSLDVVIDGLRLRLDRKG